MACPLILTDIGYLGIYAHIPHRLLSIVSSFLFQL